MAVISNGTTIIDAGAISVGGGKETLIKTATFTNASTVAFIDGTDNVVMDDTYHTYIFKCIDIHGNDDNGRWAFQVNTAGASGFNESCTSNFFKAQRNHGDTYSTLAAVTGYDQAQGTGYQNISDTGPADGSAERTHAGHLTIFNPSNTTFATQFMAEFSDAMSDDYMIHSYVSGYFDVAAAIDEVSFKSSAGTTSGIIKMYGIGS